NGQALPSECVDQSLPDDCTNPQVRAERGDQSAGRKTVRVRARIARSADGEPIVKDYRPWYDVLTLNRAFASSNVRFLLVDVEELPPGTLYDVKTDSNPLCEGELKSLSDDSIPILYVHSLAVKDDAAGGVGNHCGAVVAQANTESLYGIPGEYTDPEPLVH